MPRSVESCLSPFDSEDPCFDPTEFNQFALMGVSVEDHMLTTDFYENAFMAEQSDGGWAYLDFGCTMSTMGELTVQKHQLTLQAASWSRRALASQPLCCAS